MRKTWATIVSISLLLGAQTLAATDPASWNRDLERLDNTLVDPTGGDNAFFTYVANATAGANVVLLYPANASMKEFTQKLYKIRVNLGGAGCTNTYLDALPYFMPTTVNAPAGPVGLQGVYDPADTYPDPRVYTTRGGQSDGLNTGANSYYRYGNWPVNGAGGTNESLAAACDNASIATGGVANDANSLACQACVDPAVAGSKGYWLNPLATNTDSSAAAGVFTTNWLRFHPTKWMMLSLAYKRLVNGPLLRPLREGVLATNGTTGAQMIQKMLPQSCNGRGRPLNQKLNAINGLDYSNASRPLAELLFNTAWYMGGQDSPWHWTSTSTFPAFGNTKSGPCNGCAADFAILFADGRGDEGNAACTQVLGVTPASCALPAQCATLGLGTENDGNDFLDPALYADVGAAITGALVRQTPAGTCDMDFADDVARWMHVNNVSSTGSPVNLTVHVVGIGDPANTYGEMTTLREIATAGGGNYVPADSFGDLEDAIEQIFTSIRGASTSFASSAVTTVQTTGTSSAFIPRFTPAISGGWSGTLSRYTLFNEFSAGCVASDYGTTNAVNPNGDNSCSDFYLRQPDGGFIQEDNTGKFVMSDTSVAWGPGWPTALAADGGTVAATPYWEAGDKLTSRAQAVIAGTPPPEGPRRIYTVAPAGSGLTYDPTLVPVTVANVANLTPLFQLGAFDGDMCSQLSAATGNVYATDDACTTDLVRYILGEDVMRTNPLNRTLPPPSPLYPRQAVMGDIFHSTPILVTPPVPKFLCELGVVNQCVASLYSPMLTPGGDAAYLSYYGTNQYREQHVLVGANDGMIHAFNAANDSVDGFGVHSYDNGTGVESWAFIPPDLLPKMVRLMLSERHELMVDGTAFVRDIWVDGSGAAAADGNKDADEYHTVAIVGERGGGRGYTALDVTVPTSPRFLWAWPKPGTDEALQMGQTWGDIGGSPPAIGPIAEKDATGPLTVGGVRARERYVVAFGGGYDSNLIRGRSMHVVDAWTGQQVYRFARADNPADVRGRLASVAAPISMIDTDSDGLFDYAVFGDMDGQLWNVSMVNPGEDTTSDGRYDNWFGARAFEQRKGANNYALRHPFFHRAAVGMLTTGDIRVYLGSGDRAHLKDSQGGVCGPDDLSACLRRNCDTRVTNTAYAIGPGPTGSSGHLLTRSGANPDIYFTRGDDLLTITTTYPAVAQSSAVTDVVNGYLTYQFDCGGGYASLTTSGQVFCDWGATTTGIECPIDTPTPQVTVQQPSAPTIEDTRFYSIQLFDTSNRLKFATAALATTYDTNRLSDASLNDVSKCPTGTQCTPATATGAGWMLIHGTNQLPANSHTFDEKSAASALLFGGCTFWSTLDPNRSAGSSGTGDGTCAGGANDGQSCSANSDCSNGSGTCSAGYDTGDACDNGGDCRGVCSGGNDNGDRCYRASDCEGRCSGGSRNGRDCYRDSDCSGGGTCTGALNCVGLGSCALTYPFICAGLGNLTCGPSFPKDDAYSYQADAITGNIGCGLVGSQTYTTTTRATSHQVSVAPTQPAPVVSVNAATGLVQYSAVTLDSLSAPSSQVLGSTEISSTVHWLEVPRKVHDCRHGTSPGTTCQ